MCSLLLVSVLFVFVFSYVVSCIVLSSSCYLVSPVVQTAQYPSEQQGKRTAAGAAVVTTGGDYVSMRGGCEQEEGGREEGERGRKRARLLEESGAGGSR